MQSRSYPRHIVIGRKTEDLSERRKSSSSSKISSWIQEMWKLFLKPCEIPTWLCLLHASFTYALKYAFITRIKKKIWWNENKKSENISPASFGCHRQENTRFHWPHILIFTKNFVKILFISGIGPRAWYVRGNSELFQVIILSVLMAMSLRGFTRRCFGKLSCIVIVPLILHIRWQHRHHAVSMAKVLANPRAYTNSSDAKHKQHLEGISFWNLVEKEPPIVLPFAFLKLSWFS